MSQTADTQINKALRKTVNQLISEIRYQTLTLIQKKLSSGTHQDILESIELLKLLILK